MPRQQEMIRRASMVSLSLPQLFSLPGFHKTARVFQKPRSQ
jgi:hypothetical protein